METFWQDIRYATCTLAKRPGFTSIVVLTLALGIGANTVVFSFVNAVLLRPLPYEQAERLVQLRSTEDEKEGDYFSYPDFADLRNQNQSFEQMAAVRSGGWTLTGTGDAERLPGARVSADFFPMLGVRPVMGRLFLPEEDQPGAERVVMLHYNLWQRRFGGDANIIGRELTLNGYRYTVVGVLPPEFQFFPLEINIAEIYGTLAYEGNRLNERQTRFLAVFGKLRSDAMLAQAQAETGSITSRLAEQFPTTNTNRGVKLIDLRKRVVGDVRASLLTLLGAVGFVLLIACANVANLLLARTQARRKEIVIRSALGACRWRVMRQLLTESLLLAIAGGAAGLLLAYWAVAAIIAVNPKGLPRLGEVSLDAQALWFNCGAVLVVSIICGLIPARQSTKLDLNQSLREDAQNTTVGAKRSRLRQTMVVAEVVLAFVLLVGAGLLIRSFTQLMAVDLGFRPENVLKLTVALPGAQYTNDEQKARFIEQALERIQVLPGVESPAVANITPLSGYSANLEFNIEGRTPVLPGDRPSAEYRAVSPGLFQTLGIRLHRGRPFSEQDVRQSSVIIINEALARRHFADEDPLGKRLALIKEEPVAREIVGVIGDVKHIGVAAEAMPEIYVPTLNVSSGAYDLVVRSATPPELLISAIRTQFRELDPNLPLFTIRSMEEVVALNLVRQRFAQMLLTTFAALGLLLAALGIYGVMAYSVSRRTREMGIRMALGASPRTVLKLILSEGMELVLAGLLIGMIASLGLTQIIASLLYGVKPYDPTTLLGVSLLLVLVALMACYLPARRAAKIDPMIALRYE